MATEAQGCRAILSETKLEKLLISCAPMVAIGVLNQGLQDMNRVSIATLFTSRLNINELLADTFLRGPITRVLNQRCQTLGDFAIQYHDPVPAIGIIPVKYNGSMNSFPTAMRAPN